MMVLFFSSLPDVFDGEVVFESNASQGLAVADCVALAFARYPADRGRPEKGNSLTFRFLIILEFTRITINRKAVVFKMIISYSTICDHF
jgi:hypothetical protein